MGWVLFKASAFFLFVLTTFWFNFDFNYLHSFLFVLLLFRDFLTYDEYTGDIISDITSLDLDTLLPVALITSFLFFLLTTLSSFLSLSYLGLYGVFILNLISISFMWFIFFIFFTDIIINDSYYYIEIGSWMFLGSNYKINFSLFVDFVGISFSFLTMSIALFVYIFTFSYFRYEPLVERLLLFLNSFILSMVLLVNSGNMVVMFLGWEMIGMTSFFLINFWSSRVGTLKSAFKAYSFNKLSDVFVFISVILLFNVFFSLEMPDILNYIHNYSQYSINFGFISLPFIDLLAFSFLGAAFIKSAQFGAHIWLPDSMEAPVPASALIHSATLVSAGIYLLLRFSPVFQMSIYSQYVIVLIGSFTAFYGGWTSAFQSDLKRILAYSTISHCGFLMVSFVSFIPEFTILYLYVHGFFKASVFLSVGNVLRFNRNIQDFRRMGSYSSYLSFDSIACLLCLVNLSGLPFSLGYYIKHYLFLGLFSNIVVMNVVWSLLCLAAIIGLFYSYRLYYYTFFDIKKAKKAHYIQANRLVLKSTNFSNSSLAGNLAITSLIIISYIFSIFLFWNLLNVKNSTGMSLDGLVSLNFYTNVVEYSSFILNSGVINHIVLILFIVIIFSKWRYSIHYWNSFRLLSSLSPLLILSLIFISVFN